MPDGLNGLDLYSAPFNPYATPADFQRGAGLLGNLGSAAGLLAAGGASRLPVTTGAAIGQGIQGWMGGMAAAQQAGQEAQKLDAMRMQNSLQHMMLPVQMAAFQQQMPPQQTIPSYGQPPTGASFQPQGGASPGLTNAVFNVESGNNSNAPTSVNGARGPGQIMPTTFAQYAQPGENIDNPADNRAVAGRILADYSQRYNGDPARVAVAYFSGPQNVAPPGSPTPWIADKKDGNGVPVSAYVQRVTGQAGQAAQPIQQPQQPQDDPQSRFELQQLYNQYHYYSTLAIGNPQFATAANAALARMQDIAGPGNQVMSDGTVRPAVGAETSRFRISAAQSGGTAGGSLPYETQLAANKANIDVAAKRQMPEAMRPGGTLVTPDSYMPPQRLIMPNGSYGAPVGPAPNAPPGAPSAPVSGAANTPGMNMQRLPGGGVSFQSNAATQDEQLRADQKEANEEMASAMTAQAGQTKLNEMVNIASNPDFMSGSGTNFRAGIANIAKTYLGADAAAWLKKNAMLPDADQSQIMAKLMLGNAGTQEQSTLGARGGARAMEIFMRANPNLEMQPGAIRNILNLQRVAQQADVDYATGLQKWVSEKGAAWINKTDNYQPSQQYDAQWLGQRNPQLYAAATDVLNGKSGADVVNQYKLGKEELMRVAGIVSRVDPNAMLTAGDGKKYPVSQLLGD